MLALLRVLERCHGILFLGLINFAPHLRARLADPHWGTYKRLHNRTGVRFGLSFFASSDAYYLPGGGDYGPLRQQDVDQYFADGYVILRGLLPRSTIVAIRSELQSIQARRGPLGQNLNAWIESGAL